MTVQHDIDLFFEVSIGYLSIITREGHFLKVSRSWSVSLGWPEHELIGRPIQDFIHPEDRERGLRSWNLLISGIPLKDIHLRFRRADGAWLWLSVSAVLVPDSDAIILSAFDITQQREIEEHLRQARQEAERANKAKSQFIATMSHELRTPLNAVLGYAQLLGTYVSSEEGKRYLQSIESSGKALLALINDILDLSRAESGRIELLPIPFEIRGLVEELEHIFRLQAEEKNLLVEFQVTPEVPRTVLLDQARLRQILVNLIGNALKFTDEGSVRLLLDAVAEEESDNPERKSYKSTLIIKVIDTGIGVSEEARSKIFDPFTQQDPSIYKKYGGTGLGLAIVKRLLDLMGGTIHCESNEPRGSRFIVRIPRVSSAGRGEGLLISFGKGPQERVEVPSELPLPQPVPVQRGKKKPESLQGRRKTSLTQRLSEKEKETENLIVLVTDDASWARSIEQKLEKLKARYLGVPFASIHFYPIQSVQGVIVDFRDMGRYSGDLHRLFRKWVEGYRLPCVVVTVPAYQERFIHALQDGKIDLVLEPVQGEELLFRFKNQMELKMNRLRLTAVHRSLAETTARLMRLSSTVDLLSSVDTLTGLCNRHSLWEKLLVSLQDASQRQEPVALFLSDLEHLKNINDRLGQRAGDLVLSECGRRLSALLPPPAIVGRWSGEEFMVILPGKTQEAARAFIQEVAHKIQDPPVYFDHVPLEFHLVFGGAVTIPQMNGNEQSPQTWENLASFLVRTADDAVFRSKNRGGTTIECIETGVRGAYS
ncbi:MAG: diguanylate cyclase [Treponemataceae bacterium]|nr:diguanylate cyclase [Treponemataceae bacterium]